MLYYLGTYCSETFLRLFSSHLVLLSVGTILAGLLSWYLLPKTWKFLPCDHGKELVKDGMLSKGKPTGAGLIVALCLLPVLILVIPLKEKTIYGAIVALYMMMVFGYLDDKALKPWGRAKKGALDVVCSLFAAYMLYLSKANTIWLPFTQSTFEMPLVWYLIMASFLLCMCINSLNCSDGVDGLAGSLGIMSLLTVTVFLYLVVGYKPVTEYLHLPYYGGSEKWAILSATISGGFAGYLWHNAEPSKVLMGDAGSRMLGLAIGVAGLATGNPFIFLVIAPVVLLNGGTGLLKILVLKFCKMLGFDTTPTARLTPDAAKKQMGFIKGLHSVRFPLHDHFRNNRKWSNAQVLIRFILIQGFLIPVLFAFLMKIR